MADIRFEWDQRKNSENRRKHGVSFEEAQSVFLDHSDEEDRFVLLGVSAALRVLVVCHCYRESDEVIRIISARKANSSERTQYKQRFRQ